jgi:hypothetical protein
MKSSIWKERGITLSGRKQRANRRYTEGDFGPHETEGFLPLYAQSQKLGYDGQTETMDRFRLLLVEVLHRGMDISSGLLQRALDHKGKINKIGVVLTKVLPGQSSSQDLTSYLYTLL